MNSILNITNGDCAVEVMQKANIPGDFLPWRDVLHEGPVPGGLALDELSQVRANFIADRGWGTPDDIARHFIDRDNVLRSSGKYEKIILWFEHDLYDQLQLLQILDWFNENRPGDTTLSIICVDQYLGMLLPDEMAALTRYEKPVSEAHYELASKAWPAFQYDTPEKWQALLDSDTMVLPFLQGAVIRLLEEYPDCTSGLSRTAQQALKIVQQGEKRPGKIFARYQETEQRRFLGDASFWLILDELLESSPALLSLPGDGEFTMPACKDKELIITAAGEDVLSGTKNWLQTVMLDRWIGGVHLTPENSWCWNPVSRSIVKNS